MYTHSSPGVVTWKVGDLAPGETKDVTMKLQLDEPGTLFTMATAKAFCAETASDSCRTEPEEDTMEYVSSSGPTKATVSGNKVVFDPLPSLAKGVNVSWKVNVKAIGEGDVRFRTTMDTDELGRVVLETEATKFYQD